MTPAPRSNSSLGVFLMLASTVMFGAIFYFVAVVSVQPEILLAWRMPLTASIYISLLCIPKCRTAFAEYLAVVRAQRGGWAIVVLLSVLVTVQLWLFMWSPKNGYALDVSLGYLLLPLVLVLAGRFVFHDKMSSLQWVAVVIALGAVAAKAVMAGGLAWPVLVVSIGYTIYFMIRRRTGFDRAPGFGVEMALMTPVAIVFLLTQPPGPVTFSTAAGVVALGLLGTLAMFFYLGASAQLTMPMFGLLSYLEPLMLMAVALFVGESLSPGDGTVYGLILLALVILSIDGFRHRFTRSSS